MSNQVREEQFLSNPVQWPHWPLCPLKRWRQLDENSKVKELAILHDFDPGTGTLRLYTSQDAAKVNIFTFDAVMPEGCGVELVTPGQVYAEGWRVD